MSHPTETTTLEIEASVNDAIAGQLGSASNEVIAQCAWDAFVDACEGFDVPCYVDTFAELFPVYSELV